MDTILLIGALFVTAVIAYALGRGRRATFDQFIAMARAMRPQLAIGVPTTYELTRAGQAVRREFVPIQITSGPDGTFVELQDRESYERRHRIQ